MSQKLEKIETLIYRATDECLTQENWSYIMDVCDSLNQSDNVKNAITILQKRSMSKNANIQLYSLSLIDALVKNCGSHIQQELVSCPFIDMLLKNIEDSDTHSMVKERIFSLIQQWATYFASNPSFSYVKKTYDILQSQQKYTQKKKK